MYIFWESFNLVSRNHSLMKSAEEILLYSLTITRNYSYSTLFSQYSPLYLLLSIFLTYSYHNSFFPALIILLLLFSFYFLNNILTTYFRQFDLFKIIIGYLVQRDEIFSYGISIIARNAGKLFHNTTNSNSGDNEKITPKQRKPKRNSGK